MKKGFTLVELLAVLVILAIIALIAVPLVLNVIDDARGSSEESSMKIFVHAVDVAQVDYEVANGRSATTSEELKPYIKLSNDSIDLNYTSIDFDTNGSIVKVTAKISEKICTYTKSDKKISCSEIEPAICHYVSGTKGAVGSLYTCDLDTARSFYILTTDETDTTLLMEDTLENPVAWISNEDFALKDPARAAAIANENSCKMTHHCAENTYGPLTLQKYLDEQTSNWNVTVGIPSAEQIATADGQTLNPPYLALNKSWLYTDVSYWTSTKTYSYEVWIVNSNTQMHSSYVNDSYYIRPTITIKTSQLD